MRPRLSRSACRAPAAGGGVVGAAPTSKSAKSMFARPLAVVGLSRMVLPPLLTDAVSVLVVQVVHAPVGSNALPAWTVAPLTMMSAGRFAVAPLAYRMPIVAVPAD